MDTGLGKAKALGIPVDSMIMTTIQYNTTDSALQEEQTITAHST